MVLNVGGPLFVAIKVEWRRLGHVTWRNVVTVADRDGNVDVATAQPDNNTPYVEPTPLRLLQVGVLFNPAARGLTQPSSKFRVAWHHGVAG